LKKNKEENKRSNTKLKKRDIIAVSQKILIPFQQ